MKNSKKLIKIGLILLFSLMLNLSGCKCFHDHNESKKQNVLAASKDSFQYNKIVFLLPSPSEILFATFAEDITFKPNLIAPSNTDKKTIKYDQQALILGVYLADLSYNVLSKNHSNGNNTIVSIQNLSQNLGVGSLLYAEYFHRIDANVGNIDSLDAIYNDFTNNSFETLEESENYELLSLIAMGAGIETMYLSYKSVDFGVINSSVLPNFVGQRWIYENYYKNFLSYNKDKPELKSFINDVTCIYNLFKQYVVVKDDLSVVEKKDAHVAVKDRSSVKYNESGIRTLGDSITIVRDKLIELKYQ